MVVNDMVIEQIFAEDGIGDNVDEDPYEWSTPEKLLEYVKGEEPALHNKYEEGNLLLLIC